MAWIIILVVIILFVIFISKSNNKSPEKYTSYTDSIIKSDIQKNERIASGEHDEMYFSWKEHHKEKSLEQVEQYIKTRREENWHYWQDNRLEYKVLMDLSRELEHSRNAEIKQLVESDQIYQYSYSKLLDYYRMITYNPHIYKGCNINMLTAALEKASFDKFHLELITKTPSTVLRWLNARENKGEYIADKLKGIAEEMQQNETPEEVYKRQRKNIQSNMSKARKEGDWLKIEELQQKLINLENQN